jgi:hypothetical protein
VLIPLYHISIVYTTRIFSVITDSFRNCSPKTLVYGNEQPEPPELNIDAPVEVTPPSFFDKIPRELRNKVYKELWANTPVTNVHLKGCRVYIAHGGGKLPETRQDKIANANQHLPRWLKTSKQMLAEGLHEHRFHGTSILLDPGYYHLDVPERPQTLILPSIAQADHITITGTKLRLPMANTLHVDVETVVYCSQILEHVLGSDSKRARSVKVLFEWEYRLDNGPLLRHAVA